VKFGFDFRPVTFEVLWFQNGATCQKSATCDVRWGADDQPIIDITPILSPFFLVVK